MRLGRTSARHLWRRSTRRPGDLATSENTIVLAAYETAVAGQAPARETFPQGSPEAVQS